MNVEERKTQILEDVELLEKDIKILQKNICELKKVLPTIKTEEDAKRFDSEFDLEDGLEIIALF